jgi:hypothetical protein
MADEPTIFLASAARVIVMLHAACAIVLVGAATHHSLVALGYLRGVYKVQLGRIYAATVAAAWLVTFTLGCLAYPTFRFSVRALYLDRYEPWGSNLFDIKESFAALGLPFAIAAFVLSRVMQPKEDRALVICYAAMVFLATAVVWFDVISGIFITMAKGV